MLRCKFVNFYIEINFFYGLRGDRGSPLQYYRKILCFPFNHPKSCLYSASEVLNTMSNNKRSGMFAGKGYYIALILCAAAIGITS